MNRRGYLLVFVVCLFCLMTTMPLYGLAYADPNTVGLISQVLTPLLIIVGASVTFLRQRIVATLSGLSRRLRRRANA
jgi:drug/metabolite transporter (DMT)-like permease